MQRQKIWFWAITVGLCVTSWAVALAYGLFDWSNWPAKGSALLPSALLPLIGFLAGVVSILLLTGVFRVIGAGPLVSPPPAMDRWSIMGGLVGGAAIILIAIGVGTGKVEALPGAILLICGALCFVAAVHALDALGKGESITFDSYWGGLGGAQGGWRISPVAISIALALIFLAAMVTIMTGQGHPSPVAENSSSSTSNSSTGDDEAEPADGNSASNAGDAQ